MALQHNVNVIPATGAAAVYQLKSTLIAAGWTCVGSGDGTTYSAAGDVIVSAAALAVTRAWFILRDPGGRREICFQRGTTNLLWRIKISEEARFTGGSPNATTVRSATDEHVIFGSGTDASPTGVALFGTDGAYRFNCMAENAVYGSTNVYTWYCFATSTVSPYPTQMAMFQDALLPTVVSDSGSPIVTYVKFDVMTKSGASLGTENTNVRPFFYRVLHGQVGAANVAGVGMSLAYASSSGAFQLLGGETGNRVTPTPWNASQEYGNWWFVGSVTAGANQGLRGQLATVGFPLTNLYLWPDTYNLATSQARVFVGGSRNGIPNTGTGAAFLFPWPTSVVPVA